MDQRDWELLDKQMRRSTPPRNDGIVVLTIATVFLAGLAVGGILFGQESVAERFTGNNAKVASYLPNRSAPTINR
jgi:hypothetical protein